MSCLGVPGLASEEAGKSSRGGRGCQGRRRLPSNKIDWYTVWVTRISLIWPLRMQKRAPRVPGTAEAAIGGDHWLVTRLMVHDLPGCLWLGLWGGGEELQGQQRMPTHATITQQQDRLIPVYSMSCLVTIPHFAPEDAGKSSKGARGSKGCQRRKSLASNKMNGLWLAWVSLAWPRRRRGRAPGAAEDARAGGDCPATRQTPPPGNRQNFPLSDTLKNLSIGNQNQLWARVF